MVEHEGSTLLVLKLALSPIHGMFP